MAEGSTHRSSYTVSSGPRALRINDQPGGHEVGRCTGFSNGDETQFDAMTRCYTNKEPSGWHVGYKKKQDFLAFTLGLGGWLSFSLQIKTETKTRRANR